VDWFELVQIQENVVSAGATSATPRGADSDPGTPSAICCRQRLQWYWSAPQSAILIVMTHTGRPGVRAVCALPMSHTKGLRTLGFNAITPWY